MTTVLIHKRTFWRDVVHELEDPEVSRIMASRTLPDEWKKDARLTRAHGFYWEERDERSTAAASVYAYHTRGASQGAHIAGE